MNIAYLPDRAVLEVSGEEAEHFLDNILTCEVAGLATGEARFGALLTPQGKILFDFFLIKTESGFWLDTPDYLANDFLKRLMFYRLRAKVDLVKLENVHVTAHLFPQEPRGNFFIIDPRHADMGWRVYDENLQDENKDVYLQRRISLCVPEGGRDFEYGDAYPHEVLMDQFGGVDFKKGCYVGQEVVSRMQHRGTTKKRVIKVSSESPLPEKGTTIIADGKPAGTLGSALDNEGLALLRLDRVHAADTVEAAGVTIKATLPDWVNFSWPEPR